MHIEENVYNQLCRLYLSNIRVVAVAAAHEAEGAHPMKSSIIEIIPNGGFEKLFGQSGCDGGYSYNLLFRWLPYTILFIAKRDFSLNNISYK